MNTPMYYTWVEDGEDVDSPGVYIYRVLDGKLEYYLKNETDGRTSWEESSYADLEELLEDVARCDGLLFNSKGEVTHGKPI